MKTIEDFTELQRKKLLFGQTIINMLNIYDFKFKIGGTFANFIIGNVDDFHDIDIIVSDYELNNILFYIKNFVNSKFVDSKTVIKDNWFRINCDNYVYVNIIADVYDVVDLDKTFMNMKLVKS